MSEYDIVCAMLYGGDYLEHHQVKGAKHGVRRYQNPDGSLTPEGRIHYGVGKRAPSKAKAKAAQKAGSRDKATVQAKKKVAAKKEAKKLSIPKPDVAGALDKIAQRREQRKVEKKARTDAEEHATRQEWLKTKEGCKAHWEEMTQEERAMALAVMSSYDSYENFLAGERRRSMDKINGYLSLAKNVTAIASDAAKIYSSVYTTQVNAQKAMGGQDKKDGGEKKESGAVDQIVNALPGVLSAINKGGGGAGPQKPSKSDKKPEEKAPAAKPSPKTELEEFSSKLDAYMDVAQKEHDKKEQERKDAADMLTRMRAAQNIINKKGDHQIDRGTDDLHPGPKVPKDSGWGENNWRSQYPGLYRKIEKDGDVQWVSTSTDDEGNIVLHL